MSLSKSIDFLDAYAGDVIKYRLHSEMLKDVNKNEEENLLEKVLQTRQYKLVESYVKPNGYIGRGMHSWDHWRGQVLHETPYQDGETAVRLLSNFAIPKYSKIIADFVTALNDNILLKEEFSYIPPEISRFRDKDIALNSGASLSVLFFTCQALLGRGDDEAVQSFVNTSYKAFESVLNINSLSDLTKDRDEVDKKYKYPFILSDTYFPCQYHLETLAYSTIWRNQESVNTLVKEINHLNSIMHEDNLLHVKVGNNYYVTLWAFVKPFKPFSAVGQYEPALRKTLTHLAIVGGCEIDVVRKTMYEILETIDNDGVLRVKFDSLYQKKCFKANMSFPGPYSEIALESDHKSDIQLWCDLTFWAIQFLHLIGCDLV